MPDDDDKAERDADRLLAATLYLMSCHARTGSPRLAGVVARHLELVGGNPCIGELVRDMCRRIAAGGEPPQVSRILRAAFTSAF